MEAAVMRNADKVLTTTERMRASIVTRYPQLPPAKFVCLPNGVDLSRATIGDSTDKYDPLTITYAGSLYMDRTPEPLFQALGELVNEGKARLGDVRIKLVGSCRSIGDVPTEVLARRYGVESDVEIIDRVPHAEAIQIMQRSHLLLVLAPPNHHLCQPAKIFDYLGSGSKLLALAEPGATTDLIQETQGGVCFSQADINGLKTYLHQLLMEGAYRQLRNDAESFRRYDARSLTQQLVAELTPQPVQPDTAAVPTQSPSN
jgi:glycosyltransferase involved in cell wall biosynthesis